jgi:DnaJ-class molecular chaperone
MMETNRFSERTRVQEAAAGRFAISAIAASKPNGRPGGCAIMKKICPICHGSGQLSSFKGVSRFLLSWEECPECGGLGHIIPQEAGSGAPAGNRDQAGNGKAAETKTNRRRGRK